MKFRLRYQAYIFNGFSSLNGEKTLGGSNGLRNGRQKGAESIIITPNLSAKIDYYGIQGLRLGLSGYFGRTQAEDAVQETPGADVGVTMIGFDARYINKRFSAQEVNSFKHILKMQTSLQCTLNDADLGSEMMGWYLEAAYNLLPLK